MQILFAACAGVLCALLLAHHITQTRPASLGLEKAWSTAKAGPAYIALVAASILIPGLSTLWAALLVLRLQQKAKPASCYGSANASSDCRKATAASAAKVAVNAAAAAAAATVVAGPSGILTASGDGTLRLQLRLPVACSEQGSLCGTAGNPHQSHQCYMPVERGRPPLQQLVKAWLATTQQLAAEQPSSWVKHSVHCRVYAMGPPALVERVQLLCDGISTVAFVRKTHQL